MPSCDKDNCSCSHGNDAFPEYIVVPVDTRKVQIEMIGRIERGLLQVLSGLKEYRELLEEQQNVQTTS